MEYPKKRQVSIIVLLVLILVVLAGLWILWHKGKTLEILLSSENYATRQTDVFEILETADLNSDTPRFKLHVQSHNAQTSTPQKILLTNTKTGKIISELPLTFSAYQNECASHENMVTEMKKWDTAWFTVPGLDSIDSNYSSKLGNKYSASVVYDEGETRMFLTTNEITGVCYQVAKATPVSPMPEERDLPSE